VPLPGPSGTMNFTGRDGQSCALAKPAAPKIAPHQKLSVAAASANRRVRFMSTS
jgi:hypothetical protein